MLLFGAKVLRATAVSTHDPVPGHGAPVLGQHAPDQPGGPGADEFGDVAVGHHPAGRNRLDAGQDPLWK